MKTQGRSSIKDHYPWLIVGCGMAFYCFNYFLRVSPGVMQHELAHAFHISAYQYGALAAFYYYAYTLMQLPAGMIYDKFGVRLVLCIACLTAVLGLGIFISADSYLTAAMGRFCIGLGCAFAYIGTLKLAAIWLPTNQFGMVAGLTTAVGMISGTLSQKYLTYFVELVGYQAALKSSLVLGLILICIMFVLIRNNPNIQEDRKSEYLAETPINLAQLLHAVRVIFLNPQMWLIGVIGCLIYLPSSVFLDLWGIPYLKAVYEMSTRQAVSITSCTFYGWIISGPLMGAISDRIKRRRAPLMFTSVFAAVLLCLVFYVPNIPVAYLKTIFFLIGFCCGAHSLVFALGKENNSPLISGTAIAATNMLIMIGGVIFQPVVGKLLDMHTSSPVGIDGLPTYTANDYSFALSVVPIGVAIGVFLCLFLKETYCKSRVTDEVMLGRTSLEVAESTQKA